MMNFLLGSIDVYRYMYVLILTINLHLENEILSPTAKK